ncbi:hypothetical protein POTOM_009928 [Populus tomentosa]|uniref:Uncharacterized protein n=1 Tax=Populus tomentosa TaxID=118781 RepID=A0A8X8ANS2_POPTO|nr:hypothetical protein POTOM_009928 [Populus tomentosa]
MAAIDTGLAQAYVMRKLHKEKMERLEQAEKGIFAGAEKKGENPRGDYKEMHVKAVLHDMVLVGDDNFCRYFSKRRLQMIRSTIN